MFKLVFYVPEDSVEQVKLAVFEAGAGKIGQYDRCCWQTLGEGQFRPLEGATPAIGVHGHLQKVMEYRVEMLCEETLAAEVIAALKQAHPYEEPAYDLTQIISKWPER